MALRKNNRCLTDDLKIDAACRVDMRASQTTVSTSSPAALKTKDQNDIHTN